MQKIRERKLMEICLTCFYSFLAISDGTIGFYARKNMVSPIFRSWVQVLAEVDVILSENRALTVLSPLTPASRTPILLVEKLSSNHQTCPKQCFLA